jgi:hypothetical protein
MLYSSAVRQRVVTVAIDAARAHQDGLTSWGDFNLSTGGMCARFVRQVYERALDLNAFDWEYAAPSARDMATRLRHDVRQIPAISREPGDVLQIGSGYPGHVAIYVGEVDGILSIAENTSDASRGNPRKAGTKLTPWTDVSSRVTGVFRLCASIPAATYGIVITLEGSDGARVLSRNGRMDGDVCVVPIREVWEALGGTVTDHRADLGKVCLTIGRPYITGTPSER